MRMARVSGQGKVNKCITECSYVRLCSSPRATINPILLMAAICSLPSAGTESSKVAKGCSSDCTPDASTCGDGVIEGDEECDDANLLDGDGCSTICLKESLPPACGDGNIDSGETCDDGNQLAGDGCSPDCQTEESPTCGDGTVDPGESCDDGNLIAGDGCDPDCQAEECVPADCDDGNPCTADQCDSAQVCQNMPVEGSPACDDGNPDTIDVAVYRF